MKKIFLILQREYLVRVQKKSFIIMTILGPLLMVGITVGSVVLATQTIKEKVIQVVDESGHFKDKFKDNKDVKFVYSSSSLDNAKKLLPASEYQALLYIPKLDVQNPDGIKLFAEKNVSPLLQNHIEQVLSSELESIRLVKAGIDQKVLDQTKGRVKISTIALSDEGEKDSSAGMASGFGYVGAFLIYISVFLYGAQVMRGILEEKTSRIVEVIISSVKPFQLMLGKIIGIGLVGLTQFLLWIVLTWGAYAITSSVLADDLPATNTEQLSEGQGVAKEAPQAAYMMNNLNKALDTQNVPLFVATFLFYFLGGYLLYSALYAAVGAAADSETDTQQFMLPISIPLVASIMVAQVVLNDPDGSAAFWLSMIPFTSPIIMMVRIPFGVPASELLLSMGLLVVGFIGTTWLAARIYRVGILMYGKKVNFKELSKWIFYRA